MQCTHLDHSSELACPHGCLLGIAESGDSRSGGVGVSGLSVDTTMLNNPFDGSGHFASLATVSSGGGALNQFLLRQGRQGVSGDLPSSLHGSNRREGPAASTLSLVLDSSHCSLRSPVEGTGFIPLQFGSSVRCSSGHTGQVAELGIVVQSLELILAEVTELVDAVGGSLVNGVQTVNVIQSFGEAAKGMCFL